MPKLRNQNLGTYPTMRLERKYYFYKFLKMEQRLAVNRLRQN